MNIVFQFPYFQPNCDSRTHECLPFFYCLADKTTDGAEIFQPRSNFEHCDSISQVCCNKEDNIARYVPKKCGRRNVNGIGFHVTNNVDEAQYGEFPWMTAIFYLNYETSTFDYVCGGSLIHPHVVLTAAHCVNDRHFSSFKIRLAEWDTQTTKEIFPHSDHEVSQIIMHQDFGVSNLFNDIALIVLREPVALSIVVNTVCLPPQNNKFDDQNCFASGWGADLYEQKGLYRVNLKKLELPVVPLRTCQDNLRETKLGPRFRIHQSFMCAGGAKDVDTCTGDGGSPLVCPIGSTGDYYQGGIVAWGIECGVENVPGVYANVAKFRDWIDDHMIQLGYGTASYTHY